jgi:hypothetical protein
MKCPETVMLGVAGGAIVQLIALWGSMTTWQKARHDLLMDGKRPLPSLTRYIDPLADTLVALTRLCMGALAGLMFHDQITGITAAIAVGASGPALLAQFGARRISSSFYTEEPTIRLSIPRASRSPGVEVTK